jgi:hypothetical protein
VAAETITTALLNFFKKKLVDYQIENFYQELRDDAKEKSVTIYSLSNTANEQQYSKQVCYKIDYQIQVVYGFSVSETEALADYIHKKIVMSNQAYSQDGYHFYITPLQGRTPKYLGTLDSGYHKYGIDVLVIYNNNRKDD